MRYQDQVIKLTQKALGDVCRAALAVPEEKRTWSPAEAARSTLQQMQEIALAGRVFHRLIREGSPKVFEEHFRQDQAALVADLDTVESCVDAAQLATSELCSAIAEFPASRLDEEVTLPFGGGTVMTFGDVLELHRWNMVYHLGQINQIQLMLGDREMH
jgi:hypothetical protein